MDQGAPHGSRTEGEANEPERAPAGRRRRPHERRQQDQLDDLQVTALLQKEAAKRRDTAGIYTGAGETDRAAAEIAETEVIEAYLPKALSREEAEAIVDEVITGLKAEATELSIRSMGVVMKPVTAKIAGRFDGKAVSEIVRGRLA